MKFAPWLGARGYGYAQHPDGLPRLLRRGRGLAAPDDSFEKKNRTFSKFVFICGVSLQIYQWPWLLLLGGNNFYTWAFRRAHVWSKKNQKQNPIFFVLLIFFSKAHVWFECHVWSKRGVTPHSEIIIVGDWRLVQVVWRGGGGFHTPKWN